MTLALARWPLKLSALFLGYPVSGWPDCANFGPMGVCLLWAVQKYLKKLHRNISVFFLFASGSPQLKNILIPYCKYSNYVFLLINFHVHLSKEAFQGRMFFRNSQKCEGVQFILKSNLKLIGWVTNSIKINRLSHKGN
jgi:hypothetical protein